MLCVIKYNGILLGLSDTDMVHKTAKQPSSIETAALFVLCFCMIYDLYFAGVSVI